MKKIIIKKPRSDSLSDSLTRIRNGYMAKVPSVNLIDTKLVRNILELMKEEGFIKEFSYHLDSNEKPYIVAELLYTGKNQSSLKELKIISKPSKPIFIKNRNIKDFYKKHCCYGFGIAFISTPKGLMAGHNAAVKGLGGKVLFVCN